MGPREKAYHDVWELMESQRWDHFENLFSENCEIKFQVFQRSLVLASQCGRASSTFLRQAFLFQTDHSAFSIGS